MKAFQLVRLVSPPHAGALASDAIGWRHPVRASRTHLAAAMGWLCRAQDAGREGGIPAGYSLLSGWEAACPETTGDLVSTFFDYASYSGNPHVADRALRMGEWLLSAQDENGAFGRGADGPARQDGPILLGLTRLYRETGDHRYLAASRRLAEPMAAKTTGFDAGVGWALMELAALTGDARAVEAGRRHAVRVIATQQDNGWFRETAGRTGGAPSTHAIARVMAGLIGIAAHSRRQEPVNAALKAATQLMELFETRGDLAGEYDGVWGSEVTWRDLTGEALVSSVWLQLHALTGDIRLLNASMKLNDRLKASQHLASHLGAIRGGVKGTRPLWGRPHRLAYSSRGAKYLVEALMAEIPAVAKVGGDAGA